MLSLFLLFTFPAMKMAKRSSDEAGPVHLYGPYPPFRDSAVWDVTAIYPRRKEEGECLPPTSFRDSVDLGSRITEKDRKTVRLFEKSGRLRETDIGVASIR